VLVPAFALVGALIGAFTAHRRGGRPADLAQYAAGYGIAFAVLGMIVTIVLARIVLA
jgi:hypothetical protein